MKECAAKKASVNENFVIYFVKLLLLDPNWGITSDFVSSRDNVDSFINQVIAEMEAQQFPKIITLQMQFYFTCNMELMTTAVKRNRKDIFDHLVRLQNDIVKTEEVGPEEITKYTRKIICYITLLSGLGNPTMNTVFTEALKAFNSVMDETELMEFVQSTKGDKEEQLQQLVKVVTGIRLFNKDCQKGGEGIEDKSGKFAIMHGKLYLTIQRSRIGTGVLLRIHESMRVDRHGQWLTNARARNTSILPYLLRNALKFFTQELQDTLLTIMEKVNLLTTIVDKCYVVQQTEEGLKMVCTLTPEFAEVYMENVKDLLILYRQFELFVRKILEDMEKMSDHLKLVFCRFDDALRKIHLTVYMRIAIPANIIFPLFEALSHVWTEMQDQVLLLAKNSQILANLHSFSKYTYYNRELFESIVQDDCAYTDAERLEETANLIIESDNNEVEIYSVDDFPDIDKIQLEYLGFCCWKMIETEGGLVPGNPSMGVARYDDKNYVFSTPEACVQFSKNPKE
ncbi:hypothetical protein NQ318_009483 [Aromia moschata]|uniref:Cilia- and flagella-associated protein 206 n=1 Tax=Aromia moschata TaxID=1265417 RepID=A0AAV8Z8X0_9CUCU|nr:hypothetical protein NQ318_009483 [Aromia moschata]